MLSGLSLGWILAGVAAIARAAGHRVTGADQGVYPPMSEQLAALGIDIVESPPTNTYHGVVLAVGHDQFRKQGIDAVRGLARSNGVVYDVKSIFSRPTVDARL